MFCDDRGRDGDGHGDDDGDGYDYGCGYGYGDADEDEEGDEYQDDHDGGVLNDIYQSDTTTTKAELSAKPSHLSGGRELDKLPVR